MTKTRRLRPMILLTVLVMMAAILGVWTWTEHSQTDPSLNFDGERAVLDVQTQLSFGPRIPGTQGHQKAIAYIQNTLVKSGWVTELQQTTWDGYPIQNIIAKRGDGNPWIILGAHYDTRIWADQDLDAAKRQDPVPGANDGASGVSVLLELARILPKTLNKQIWLVFFDYEDDGGIQGRDWILGSRAFTANLQGKPDAVVVVDMVGDANLNIYRERNSTPELADQIWSSATRLGFSQQFIDRAGYSILDDHTPFLEAGIPALDIIDFDYPFWHTTADTADKISATSLQIVGKVLTSWLTGK